LSLLLGLGWTQPAAAFCGFYVASADSKLYANATMVVLMRDGTRTVLSMQNNYQGPAEAFALVIPVPSVLKKEQVKTLPREIFEHVDALGAPRLVEYSEADPCAPQYKREMWSVSGSMVARMSKASPRPSVKVEARFEVGEYDVVILSASDSSGLERWLLANHYRIPSGSAPVLAPYVAAGTKFFVAKVDPKRVTFKDGQALLSPLRFYYDTPEFSLPVRLGLLNSHGQQDLIVNVLAADRYELANYPNVSVPTNLIVRDSVRGDFAGFYEALFSRMLEQQRGAIVTEYAWDSGSCDPCPSPPLSSSELATLGADVVRGDNAGSARFTLTRLHYRYNRETLGADLVFKRAPALLGGRGVPNQRGELDTRALTSGSASGGNFAPAVNTFQGRYVILHAWSGATQCETPLRGQWDTVHARPPTAKSAVLSGSARPPANLPALLVHAVPALGLTPASGAEANKRAATPNVKSKQN
jgi:hypothetical protein